MGHVPKMASRGEGGARSPARRLSPEEERELVRQAKRGNQEAYAELVRRHQQRVLAVVGGVLRQREDVEDVAQQVLVKAYFSLRRFDQRSAFGTWLYKIAVNECWDYLRRKKVRPLVYEADLSEEQARQMERAGPTQEFRPSPIENALKRAELRQLLERLLSHVEEKDRLMLVLKEVEGFSVEEIGEILDLNVNTVKVRLFRARGKLMEVYRRRMKQGN